MEMFKEKS